MASLKEVKLRIQSVKSTRKITSAMKMVASSKLHHAQQRIENLRPYAQTISRILACFNTTLEENFTTPLAIERPVKRVCMVVFTSNSSLCGAFNSTVIKNLKQQVEIFTTQQIEIHKVYAFGKKALEACRKINLRDVVDCSDLIDHPNYESTAQIANEIMNLYLSKEIDSCSVLFHHFKSSASQIFTNEQYLPLQYTDNDQLHAESNSNNYYIVEPTPHEVMADLLPKVLNLQLYTKLLDSVASEHAARIIAMQVATDNADELLNQLQLQYNKGRQAAITAELLDIVGGSMA